MTRRHTRRRALAAGIMLLGAALAPAHAGTITGASTVALPGFSTGTLGPLGSTPAPNNDNATSASPNLIPYSIFYNAQGVGIADVEYIVAESGGTTEYFVTQRLINNTGQAWTGFRFELGFGVGADFVRSGVADLLDFDTPQRDPAPTSSAFGVLDHQDDTLDWSGGTVPSIGVVQFAFSIDVPDDLQAFHPGGLGRFTLRQVQVVAAPVPVTEPGSLGLLTGAAAACLVARRRRRSGAAAGIRATAVA